MIREKFKRTKPNKESIENTPPLEVSPEVEEWFRGTLSDKIEERTDPGAFKENDPRLRRDILNDQGYVTQDVYTILVANPDKKGKEARRDVLHASYRRPLEESGFPRYLIAKGGRQYFWVGDGAIHRYETDTDQDESPLTQAELQGLLHHLGEGELITQDEMLAPRKSESLGAKALGRWSKH